MEELKHKTHRFALVLLIAVTAGCGLKLPTPKNASPKPIDALLPPGVTLELPRNAVNARDAARITDAGAIVLVVVNGNEIYLNRKRVQRGQIGNELKGLLPGGSNQPVYFVADAGIGYALFEEIRNLAREVGVQRFELVASGKEDGDVSLRSLALEIPPEPDPTQKGLVKPNPLILVVKISQDRKIRLNSEDTGDVENLNLLSDRLEAIFIVRKQNGVYRVGTTEVESTVVVDVERSVTHGDLVKVVDSLKGAGAGPILSGRPPEFTEGMPEPPRAPRLSDIKL